LGEVSGSTAIPYDIPRFDRDTAKRAFNILVNAMTTNIARWAIACLFDPPLKWEGRPRTVRPKHTPAKEAFAKADRLITMIKSRHKTIEDDFGSDRGVHLQLDDSRIMGEIQRRLMRSDLPAVCLHDAIAVPENEVRAAHEIMAASFYAVVGSSHCSITIN
jgi:hypothetical protein